MNSNRPESIREFFQSFSPEEIEEINRVQILEAEEQYECFVNNLDKGLCYLCTDKLDGFNEAKPCLHWFTYPSGIKKKHFEKLLSTPLSFFQLDSYFRWLANSESPLQNINDLSDERSATSYFESTIRYKNIEWAFSVGHTDLAGHPDAKVGSTPHYHIQMFVEDRILLKFNDFHVEFTESDLFTIKALEEAGDLVIQKQLYGEGMGMLEDEEGLKLLDSMMQLTDYEEKEVFNRQTMIRMPNNEAFSSDLIQQAFEESNRTKEPVGKILERLIAGAKITTIITPGQAVPKMSKRSGKK